MKKLISAFLCFATLATTAMSAEEYGDISLKDLKKAIAEKKVTVIDVNGEESFQKNHIPSAVDYTAHKEDLAKVLPEDKDALIVAYCGNPACNAYKMAAKDAVEMGYTNVKHYSGGIAGWMKAGEKTEASKAAEKG